MTTAATLVQRTRRFVRDWPEGDALTASCTAGSNTLTVADATIYGPGTIIQVDQEGMQVRSGATTVLTVLRGARGSTAASHTSGSTVLMRPRFLDVDYLDALNAGISASFPWIYEPVTDESITTTANLYEYTIPNLDSVPIPYISKLSLKETSDLAFREFYSWEIIRGATPKIKIRRTLAPGTLRIYGFGPVPQLASLAATLSSYYPAYAEDALIMFAAQYLLAGAEAARVREDTGARDQRENANRPGGAMSAANAIFSRFQARLMAAGLPPMPKHTKSIL